ncbi:MAG: bile acid:sodium symporter family protein [Labilithrix sp.]|nr:bile acid:sodium symporter family protein [Labilithrix sp.]
MQDSIATAVLLPLALAVIMFGLGMSLTPADFARVIRVPRAVFVGLFCQMVLLPGVALLLAHGLGLSPELAVGLMLLAASPGGATANLFSHLAKGDVALNVTLTAVNSVLSLFTLPFIVNFALDHFMGAGQVIPLQAGKVVQVFAVVLVPVAIGMLVHARRPDFARRATKPIKAASVVFLVCVVLAAALKERAHLGGYFARVGLAALAFNVCSLGVGYVVPLVARLPHRQAVAIGMEIGIHNGTLAIAIAMSPLLLGNATMAIPAAVYSLVMFVTAGTFAWLSSARSEATKIEETPLAPLGLLGRHRAPIQAPPEG